MLLNNNFASFLTNKEPKPSITENVDIEKIKLSINIPKEKKGRALLIEPHPDDVVLSMGGSLVQFAKNSIDITCLCMFSKGGQKEPIRKAENRYVWEELLGCDLLFGDLADYAYRKEEKISELHTYRECVSMIQRTISAVKPDFLIGPMGIGEHIDHTLVNEALMNIIKKKSIKIIFYEDFPYANRDKYYYMKAINKVKNKIDITPLYNPVTEQIEDKAKLNMVYQSQYQLVWNEVLDLYKRYGKAIGYEGIYMKKLLNPFELYERFWIQSLNNGNPILLFPNGVY
jgi:LmbE family N-acetylglucosaminyl deacetylase